MVKAKKLPSGSWNVQVFVGYDDNGKKIRKSFTAPTKQEAEFLASRFKAHNQEINRDTSCMTLSEAIDKYIEFKGNTLSPSTIRGYEQIKRNGLPSIMHTKMNKLTVAKVQAAINQEVGIKKTKTIKNEIGLIKSVLKMYAPDLSLNSLTLPQREKFEAQELTLKEVIILLKAIQDDSCAIPLLLALCCGLRASELLGLTWKDYDATNRTISIHTAVVPDENNILVRKGTKTTNSTRKISIPSFLADLLNSQVNNDINASIVTLSLPCVRKHLCNICKVNNIPRVRLHDLRHINASIMLYLNIPNKHALERGGWDDIKTMDKIYQFTFKDEKKIIDDKINDFFINALNNTNDKNST